MLCGTNALIGIVDAGDAMPRTKKKSAGKTVRTALRKKSAPPTKVTAESLATLGPARLAALLGELAEDDAALKRRLKLELAALHDPGSVGREVRKRIETLARSRAFVDWDRTRGLARDLDDQRRAIVERVAKVDPAEAHELIWRFMALAEPTYERCDDSNGDVGDVFRQACEDLGPLAVAAKPDKALLAERCAGALFDNGYGQFDALVAALVPALGRDGLLALKQRVEELAAKPAPPPPKDEERRVIGWGSSGPVYEDAFLARKSDWAFRSAMQDIADALGDVDAYIAGIKEEARSAPGVAAEVATRLLAAGRAGEARDWLERAREDRRGRFIDSAWESVYLDALEALGERDKAQALRWEAFEQRLDAERLKEYLARLPDFEDVEAEERAIAHAAGYANLTHAIIFLAQHPALEKAAETIRRRANEIDGNAWYALPEAADALAGKYPFEASLLLRALIDFSLDNARAKRYRHAARHLAECESLASHIKDFGAIPSHTDYVAGLKEKHPRKAGFWSVVAEKFGN